MEMMLEMLGGAIGSFIGPILGALLSGVILTYCIRWFIFVKAGEKGWKALIPFYSDYVQYKIVWDGRIYLALLAGSIGGSIVGAILGLIHPALGTIISTIIGVAVAGASAVAKMIMNFKYARAFGQNDYFAVGLYFLNNVFSAILAFGQCKYKGAVNDDGIGVPRVLEDITARSRQMGYQPVQQPVQPVQPRPMQPPVQPMQQPQQGFQGYQQPYNTGNYPPVQSFPQQNYPQQGNGQQPPQQYNRGFMQQPYPPQQNQNRQ